MKIFLFLTALILSGLIQAKPVILLMGDSLTAGYGVAAKDNYPNQLQGLLNQSKLAYEVVNAGLSGDTTSGGLARISGFLSKHKPEIVVVALGANDAFRGKSTRVIQKNLDGMIQKVLQTGATCVLAGMYAPPNYGKKYTTRFKSMYTDLKSKYKLPFIPFLLEGIAANKSLNLGDGIHPNRQGYTKMSKTVFDVIKAISTKKATKKKVNTK